MGDASNQSPGLIVTIISKLLTDLVARNDQLPLMSTQITPFHSSKPPTISVHSYLEDRILKYAGCSEETFILALIYIDQVVQFNPEFVISSLNIHRLLITSIMLASKFFDDVYYNNAYYARVGGISNVEVNSLEIEMLRMISFSLFVQPDQYDRYRCSLYSHVSPVPPGLLQGSARVPQTGQYAISDIGTPSGVPQHAAAAEGTSDRNSDAMVM